MGKDADHPTERSPLPHESGSLEKRGSQEMESELHDRAREAPSVAGYAYHGEDYHSSQRENRERSASLANDESDSID
ncbi:hypothetical protein PoB_003998500 [Plakobranchus ocellatus]|uniref:Uncharacterized protein n=1 Tax=Plakobranchus ocellatus TaxID=259542 RepID=A0AAV4AYM9_9GAST|nr:hypothetical protein PoB_003998500 [Plakobranchus ocellatus]